MWLSTGLLRETLEETGTRWDAEKGDVIDTEEAVGDDGRREEGGEGSEVSWSFVEPFP